ncbi:MAG: long-chain fatty acid--CoA ligase [Geopsychrobacter sp.]|nr:long-chain fatty acid--CoA ligase [Geopsychrobacter sp.]
MSNLPYKSVPAMLRDTTRKHADRPAISYKKSGQIITLSYAEFYMRVLMAARGLRKAGMAPGDRVAIFSENRAGWAISDLGVQSALGITVPIYATNTGEQAAYVINHSGARIVFVSTRQQYEKLIAVKDQIPNVELVISYDRFLGLRELPVYSLYQLSEVSYPLTDKEQEKIEGWIDEIKPDDLITVIYTSGTTGNPKGVMLSQSNMVFNATAGMKKLEGLDPTEVFLSFLPLSHVLERTAGYHAALLCGCHIAFAESVDKVIENILDFRPSVMVSVPRLFEKIYSRIYENVHQSSAFKRWLFHRAVARGREFMLRRFIEPRPIGFLLRLEHKFLDRLVFSKIRARFGGNLRYFISGGAPLDKTINEFMWTIGIPTFEGYGLTETSPAVTLNAPWKVRFGSVGTLLEETEAKLAEDGELLLKGPQIMSGYYEDPQATAEAFVDGWFKTGDIAKIDEDGYIFIVDRKKEIIVTAGGKNIAPQAVENELRLDKFISQAYVFGDRKPYLVALLTPNIDRVLEFAKAEKLPYLDTNELVSNRRTLEL